MKSLILALVLSISNHSWAYDDQTFTTTGHGQYSSLDTAVITAKEMAVNKSNYQCISAPSQKAKRVSEWSEKVSIVNTRYVCHFYCDGPNNTEYYVSEFAVDVSAKFKCL